MEGGGRDVGLKRIDRLSNPDAISYMLRRAVSEKEADGKTGIGAPFLSEIENGKKQEH